MEDIIKYMLFALAAAFILFLGYKMITEINGQECSTEIAKFEIDMKDFGKNLRFGARELHSYALPCNIDEIYFFDTGKSANPSDFNDVPVIKDMISSKSRNNIFLVKERDVRFSFYAGDFELDSPYICLKPKAGRISFFAEGAGKSLKVTLPSGQLTC